MRLVAVLATLISIAVVASDPINDPRSLLPLETAPEFGYRLPNNTRPIHYDIKLTTHVHKNDWKFEGKVTIHLKAVEDTDHITIHWRQINFIKVELYEDAELDNKTEIGQYQIDDLNEFLIVPVTGAGLKKDQEVFLNIEYNGELRDDNSGFYRSSYNDENGNTVWLATTQFEQTDARHAFPCYDEPGIRAEYTIAITHGKVYYAYGNMPEHRGDETDDEYVTTTFEKTPPVQSYLVAFLVSDFGMIKNNAGDGVIPHRIFARKEAIASKEADFALESGDKLLKRLETQLKVGFYLPKMDQAAIPDFTFGAMENWGLVTFREEILLWNEVKNPLADKRRTASVVAHEFSHQWFGDLVNPAWWEYLWLNEGFATFFEHYTTAAEYPEWRLMDLFVPLEVHRAMDPDSYQSTRPMSHYVETPDAITALFDDIAYAKSGSVLRMWMHTLGEETFMKGLNYYLTDMELKPATSDDLARNLNKAAKEDGKLPEGLTDGFLTIVNSWSRQKGYPVVTVKRNGDKLSLTQEQFWIKSAADPGNTLWWVPINVVSSKDKNFTNTAPQTWMKNERSIEISTDENLTWDETDWIILNKQLTGYYRVNYEPMNWNAIAFELSTGDLDNIHVLNRAQLIDDAFNLARSGRQTYEVAFSLGQYLRRERDYIPWSAADRAFNYLNRLLGASNEVNKYLQRFIQESVTPLYEDLGIENVQNEPLLTKLARTIAINWACLTGNEECLEATSSRLKEEIEDPTKRIDADLRSTFYCNGLRQAAREDWDKVWTNFEKSNDAAERTMIISGLACTEDAKTLDAYLEYSVAKDNSLRNQERNRVLSSVYTAGVQGLEAAIRFLNENYKQVEEMYDNREPTKVAVRGISTRIGNNEQLESFKELLEKLVTDNLVVQTESDQMVDAAKENLAWIDDNTGEITDFFKGFYRESSTAAHSVSIVAILAATLIAYLL